MLNWIRKLTAMLTPSPVEIPANALLIDVRSAGEYQSGHVDGAINVPLDGISQQIRHACPDAQQAIVVYCQSGMRSAMARQQLQGMGFANVVNGGGVGALSLRLQKPIVKQR